MSILFDTLMSDQASIPESIGVSTSGKYVISSNNQGTFLETVSDSQYDPILLLPEPCDTIGFFGDNIDAVALASGSTLRILQLSRMTIVAKITITPGSLFVPKSGESPYVGVVSGSGQTYLIDEDGVATKSTLKVGSDHDVLWSSQANPSGYSWVTDKSANLYIRSRKEDRGAVLSSVHGMTLYSIYRDYSHFDDIASLSTVDEPHILKSARSAADSVIVHPVVSFDPGVSIDQVVQLPSGRPLVVSGYSGARVHSAPVGEDTKLSVLVESVLSDASRYTAIQCVGLASYLAWEQTPVTPPFASVTNYATTGRPRYDIVTARSRSEVQLPKNNEVLEAVGPDGNLTAYRLVSPYLRGRQLADSAVVIVDDEGMVSSGKYSPSVEYLYRMGVPVVIVPVNEHKSSSRIVSEDLIADLDDVSEDVLDRKIARKLVLVSGGMYANAAVKAFSSRRSHYDRLTLIDPVEESVARIPNRKQSKVTVLSTGPDPVSYGPVNVDTQVVNTADDIATAYSTILNH